MDGVPPPKYHLAAKRVEQSEENTVTFKGGRIVLEGDGWTGPMKSLVPGWSSARKYARGTFSVQIAYRDSLKDVEILRQILASGKVDKEVASVFVLEPIENIKLVSTESIGKHQLLCVETESRGRAIKSLVTECGASDSPSLVKIITSESKNDKGELRKSILRSIKFDKSSAVFDRQG